MSLTRHLTYGGNPRRNRCTDANLEWAGYSCNAPGCGFMDELDTDQPLPDACPSCGAPAVDDDDQTPGDGQ